MSSKKSSAPPPAPSLESIPTPIPPSAAPLPQATPWGNIQYPQAPELAPFESFGNIPSTGDIASSIASAYMSQVPGLASFQQQINKSPEYGIEATTRSAEEARKNVFSQEQGVREQLLKNVLSNLQSPTGISPEQQAAKIANQYNARKRLEESMRTRANLGGGLYGGRSAASEAESVGQLERGFAEQDIDREATARENAQINAFRVLTMLFPELGLMQPSFINPVVSPESALSSSLQGRGQDIGYTLQGRGQNLDYILQNLGQRLGYETSTRGQDIDYLLGTRGQDLGFMGQGRGQNLDYTSQNRAADLQYLMQQEANQTALRAALYQSIGSAVGGASGGYLSGRK